MTFHATHILVGAIDKEFGRGVIERTHYFPLQRRVAAFAGKFRFVRIGMTRVTGLGTEMVLTRHTHREAGREAERQRGDRVDRPVTVIAGYVSVTSGECEFGL